MSYTIKINGDKKIISGSYIPEGYSCRCKEKSYRLEVPKSTDDVTIGKIIDLIQKCKCND